MSDLTFDKYQELAERTSGAYGCPFGGTVPWKFITGLDLLQMEEGQLTDLAYRARGEKRLMAAAMGLSGEAGEVTDYLKKVTAHGHPLDLDVVEKELGDVLWYVAEVASSLGLSLTDIAQKNIEKLEKRYQGQFSSEKSIQRAE